MFAGPASFTAGGLNFSRPTTIPFSSNLNDVS